MQTTIYQIKIILSGSKPSIWRRLLVQPEISLEDFHKVIQTAMGWENSHLHHFVKDDRFYTKRMADDEFWIEMNNVDYQDLKISDLLTREKEVIQYEYDFGDGWIHDIALEKILPFDAKKKYPVCIAGKRNCPPEDCGGIWGYANMLQVLKNPQHEEYEDMMEWLGGDFDPDYFDKEEINDYLEEDNYGCFYFSEW